MTRTCVLAAISLLSGCMLIDNIGPQQRFSDQVHELNESARWGRLDLAVQSVVPAHRSAFMAQHRSWTSDVRVADVDVTNLEMQLPDGSLASTVAYQWIDERTMELHATTVRQRWISSGDGFVLASETIIGGEPELLDGAPVRDDDPATAGGDEGEWQEVALVADDPQTAEDVPEASIGPAQPTRTRRRDPQGQLID